MPPRASLAFIDAGPPPAAEACGLCEGEAAEQGAAPELLLVLEGDAWK